MTAMQLADIGKRCVSLTGAQAGILTDGVHGAARILSIDTARIMRELDAGKIVVAAGFQGAERGGDTTTLGRGGSDTTAVELAAALKADRCEIYSDVDGIYTADPRLVTGAVRLDSIDYGDMLHLALHGSQVLHSRSVEAAMRANVRVHLLSSFTRREGTVMCKLDDRPGLCGVTRDPSLGTVSIIGREADAHVLAEAVAALAHSDIRLKISQFAAVIGCEWAVMYPASQKWGPCRRLSHFLPRFSPCVEDDRRAPAFYSC